MRSRGTGGELLMIAAAGVAALLFAVSRLRNGGGWGWWIVAAIGALAALFGIGASIALDRDRRH